MHRSVRRWLLSACLACLLPWSAAAVAQPAFDWLGTVDQATSHIAGVRGDRARAIAWLAAFNALDAIDPRYRPYAPSPAPANRRTGTGR